LRTADSKAAAERLRLSDGDGLERLRRKQTQLRTQSEDVVESGKMRMRGEWN
jgi:hypothetical protein